MSNESPITTTITTLFSGEMTEQGLAELRERFPKEVVHDMTNEAQFKAGRKVRTERNKLVEAIKARRIGVTSEIKVKADDLTNEVQLIFASVVGPFEVQLEINKKAKEKAERELKQLLDGQRIEINGMNNFVTECIGKTSQSISEVVEAVDLIDTTCFHKEIIHEAIETKSNVLRKLSELLTQAINEETLQIERQKLADQQAAADLKQRIDEKINNLRNMPMQYFGKTSKEVNEKIAALNAYKIDAGLFGDRTDEAAQAIQLVIQQLTQMAIQQKSVEDTQVLQAELSKKVLEPAPTAQEKLADAIEAEVETANHPSMAEAMAKAAPTLSGMDMASGPGETATVEMVTIFKAEYDQLLSDSLFLGCLMGAGVDNWDGYSDAQEAMEDNLMADNT